MFDLQRLFCICLDFASFYSANLVSYWEWERSASNILLFGHNRYSTEKLCCEGTNSNH